MEALNVALRDEFIRLYTETDILADARANFERMYGFPFPDPPTPGTLDLSSVRDSLYFFS